MADTLQEIATKLYDGVPQMSPGWFRRRSIRALLLRRS